MVLRATLYKIWIYTLYLSKFPHVLVHKEFRNDSNSKYGSNLGVEIIVTLSFSLDSHFWLAFPQPPVKLSARREWIGWGNKSQWQSVVSGKQKTVKRFTRDRNVFLFPIMIRDLIFSNWVPIFRRKLSSIEVVSENVAVLDFLLSLEVLIVLIFFHHI